MGKSCERYTGRKSTRIGRVKTPEFGQAIGFVRAAAHAGSVRRGIGVRIIQFAKQLFRLLLKVCRSELE